MLILGHQISNVQRGAKSLPLHRAFSLFLFNEYGDLLLQRRALHKHTFPGLWSNTLCSHPLQGETLPRAVVRKMRQELNLEIEEPKAWRRIIYAANCPFSPDWGEHERTASFIMCTLIILVVSCRREE